MRTGRVAYEGGQHGCCIPGIENGRGDVAYIYVVVPTSYTNGHACTLDVDHAIHLEP